MVLTIEKAPLARHGVYPAQPALERFKCYKLGQKGNFKQRKGRPRRPVRGRKTKVKRRAELCNPVQKSDEPFLNKRAPSTPCPGPTDWAPVSQRNPSMLPLQTEQARIASAPAAAIAAGGSRREKRARMPRPSAGSARSSPCRAKRAKRPLAVTRAIVAAGRSAATARASATR